MLKNKEGVEIDREMHGARLKGKTTPLPSFLSAVYMLYFHVFLNIYIRYMFISCFFFFHFFGLDFGTRYGPCKTCLPHEHCIDTLWISQTQKI